MKTIVAALFWVLALAAGADDHSDPLTEAISGEHRTPDFAARDKFRHPAETLEFFSVGPDMSVIEIWPGGGGWYTEVLAPYLKQGTLYAAHFPAGILPYYDDNLKKYQLKLADNPAVYGRVRLSVFDPKRELLEAPEGGVDRVLTFRNVHNWLRSESEQSAFELFFEVLKPGGILGVVEHRAKPGTDWSTMKVSGYMTEAYVIELAEKAGFVLDDRSEINANALDTTDHPKGVWTLPPTLRLKDQDREKYLAIGESDRMTLRFIKPEKP